MEAKEEEEDRKRKRVLRMDLIVKILEIHGELDCHRIRRVGAVRDLPVTINFVTSVHCKTEQRWM